MSMIVKQIKIQHGLTSDELMHYRLTIYQNSLDSAQALVRAIHSMGIQYVDPMNHAKADHILNYCIQHHPSFVFSPKIAQAIHHLWQDPTVSKVMDRRGVFSLNDRAEYFLKEILRIGSSDYLPTNIDILRIPRRWTQLIETHFTFGTIQITITDIGRQHSPKQWAPFFENIAYIMFCVSLCDYDLVLQGDDCQNQLNDSLIIFESVMNSRRFLRPTIILFITDIDVFKDKLSKVPLQKYFPEYSGGADFNEANGYIRSRFMQANRAKLPLYFIQDNAVDSAVPQAILDIVKKTTLENAWKDFRRTPSWSAALRMLRLRHSLGSSDHVF